MGVHVTWKLPPEVMNPTVRNAREWNQVWRGCDLVNCINKFGQNYCTRNNAKCV